MMIIATPSSSNEITECVCPTRFVVLIRYVFVSILSSGYMKAAEAAKAEIQKKVDELEAMTEITVEIDSRIHPRIIGGRGRNVKQIMTDFKASF